RCRRRRIRLRRRRGRPSRRADADAAASPDTRAAIAGCCRSSASIRWSSTGRSAAASARMSSPRASGSTRPPCSATRSASCRRSDQHPTASAVNSDETGSRLRGGKRTLWSALTERAAVFRIAADRHEREAKALLGEDFEGVVCSDRWWAYNYLDPERRQLCWAHLLRDFTAHSEAPLAAQKEFGTAGLAI